MPIASLVTCTNMLCPGLTKSLMALFRLAAGLGAFPTCNSGGSEASSTYKKAFLSSPMSTNAACIPGKTLVTLPR